MDSNLMGANTFCNWVEGLAERVEKKTYTADCEVCGADTTWVMIDTDDPYANKDYCTVCGISHPESGNIDALHGKAVK